MPERKALLMERGIRYGDNRVVCGVHHPSDVAEGRHIAIAYFSRLDANTTFQHDVACAGEEHHNSVAARKTSNRPDYSDGCRALAITALQEALQTEQAEAQSAASLTPQ